jgi:[acyl-carrier-protein] S-malonyltransferase
MPTFAGVFPGQGSQSVGMGKFLYENFKTAQLLFEEASDTLNQDFKKLCFEGPESDLTLTANTQPALLLVSTATERVLQELRPTPYVALAGHSIGEYAAVVAAGSVKFSDALTAVRARGLAMQEAVPVGEGAMLAVLGLTPELTAKLCRWTMEKSGFRPLEPANDNAPGQVVISGSAKAAEWLRANFKPEEFDPEAKRVKLIPLNVSAPFHCSLMKPAEDKMAHVLGEMNFVDAKAPVVQNFTAKATTSATELRKNLVSQVSGQVRWVECVRGVRSLGASHLIELGAGKVLAGLVKKIEPEMTVLNVNSIEDLKAIESL